jgi:hypothetical protein
MTSEKASSNCPICGRPMSPSHAEIDTLISQVWRSYVRGELDEERAGQLDAQLRRQRKALR